jgi:hypothetical protein
MAELGFQPLKGAEQRWVWRGRPPARVADAPPLPDNGFAALAAWSRGG